MNKNKIKSKETNGSSDSSAQIGAVITADVTTQKSLKISTHRFTSLSYTDSRTGFEFISETLFTSFLSPFISKMEKLGLTADLFLDDIRDLF